MKKYIPWLSMLAILWFSVVPLTLAKARLPNEVWFGLVALLLTLIIWWRFKVERLLEDHWSVGLERSVLDDLGPPVYWTISHIVGTALIVTSAIGLGEATGVKAPTGVLLFLLVPLFASRQVWGIWLMGRMDDRDGSQIN